MAANPRIAVIGAGPAGLSAAHALARGGASVVVFEAADAVGGRTRTYPEAGFLVDPATQLFGNVYTHFLRVLREAGAMHLCVRTAGRDALFRKGKAHEVVYGSTSHMMASGALPLGLKLRMGAKYLPYLHRHADALDLHALEKAARAGLDAESAAAWGAREIGRDFVDLLAHPLLTTLYGATPEETSAGFYHALARQGTVLQVVALRGGSGAFCDAVAAAFAASGGTVRTGTAVRSVAPAAEGVEVSGDGWSERFDGCVVAVPASVARELIGEAVPAAGKWLEDVRGRPAATLAVALDRPVGARYFGLSFARGESRSVAAACVEACKLPDRVPPGKGLLVVFPYPEVAVRMMEMEADEALALLLPDLRGPFPGLDAAVAGTRLYRFPHGWTVFHPGYLAHLGRFRAGAVEADARIALAGDYLRAPNVEGAVTSGLAAARRLLERLGGGREHAAAAD